MIHLGHNRSVADVVRAAIQEDADGIAISSYQGGHVEYFKYAVDMLRERGRRPHPRVRRRRRHDHAGGDRRARGLRRRADLPPRTTACTLGLVGMIDDLVERAARAAGAPRRVPAEAAATDDLGVARMLSALEDGVARRRRPRARCAREWTRDGRGRPGRRHHRHRRRGQVARSPTSCSRASSSTSPTCASRCSRSTRPGAAPAARCSATASG